MDNKLSPLVAEALERLTRAVDRLDNAVGEVPAIQKAQRDLSTKLAEADRHNEILREAANRVASRLDGAIVRLSQALRD